MKLKDRVIAGLKSADAFALKNEEVLTAVISGIGGLGFLFFFLKLIFIEA